MRNLQELYKYDRVPAQYVHRNTVRDVLLTDWRQIGQETFTLRARWPAQYTLFGTVCGRWHDPLLIAETVRQAGLLIAHAEYQVPAAQHFLMHELDYSVAAHPLPVAARAVELDLRLVGYDVRRSSASLSSMRYEVDLFQQGRQVGKGSARFSCATPAAYRRLRGARAGAAPQPDPPGSVTPGSVGRIDPDDVVLARGVQAQGVQAQGVQVHGVGAHSAGHRRWQLRVDPAHRALADHPVDHVPGMLLVEAARQAAEAVTDPGQVVPVSLACTFHRYVEYDEPCWIDARRGPTDAHGDTLVRVDGRQDDQLMFSATLTVRRNA
jgi:hypothetical protein